MIEVTAQAFYFEVLAQEYVYYGNNSSTVGEFAQVQEKAKEIYNTAHVHTTRTETIPEADFAKHNWKNGTPKQLKR